ncbi:signal-regulatory protein beta-2-like [Scomber japonicus]|uniref:signal-regulatory protein beta-2-like n=1 Tax=Scomber japonicus TaxID=13676 RepID=UPI0023053BB2|nr:signal-regulatory protein beta-2-like [Scomber japonicus]
MMVYTLNVFLLCSLCAAQVIKITQPVSFQSVKPGDSATIKCHIKSDMYKRVWYKLTTGKTLQLVTAFDSHYKHVVFADEFRQRYSVKFNSTSSHLDISATTWEDVGTYYCGVMKLNDIEFGPGTFLMLKGAKMISDSVIQKPESESVQPGRSVTLSCSVHTDRCAAEHTHVLWLKNSDHSDPEMIHSSGNKNDTCQRTETGSGEATCVYHLLMRNLSSDDAGTYYCAVTSCGEVLLGKGTKIKMNSGASMNSPEDVYFNIYSFIVFLGVLVYQNEDTDHFPASKKNKINKCNRLSRQSGDIWSECIYFRIKQ